MTSETPAQPPAAPESDVSALRESLAAATPGPWEHGHEGLQGGEVIRSAQTRIARVYKSNWPDYKPDCENAALIVAAVNALPALLADLEAARERLRVVEGERDAARAEERMRAEDHARAWRQVEAHERRRTEIEDILDEVLGTEEDDGAGEGLVADVQLAVDRLAARAESAEAAHEALRKGVEALAETFHARIGYTRSLVRGKTPSDKMNSREANVWTVAESDLRALADRVRRETAAETLREAAVSLRGSAVHEFGIGGPRDARGAAIWDAAASLDDRADHLYRRES